MFVAQQVARSRVVRTTFVVACLIPCALVVAWAGWRRTDWHRDSLVRHWAGAVGMPLSVDSIEHVRPGSLRLHGVSVADDRGGQLVEIPRIDVESSGTEVRIRLPELTCSPAAIAAIVHLGRGWLDEPARFDRNVVIDVTRIGFADAVGSAKGAANRAGVRIECVGTESGRAIRLRTEPESEEGFVVQSLAGTDGPGRRMAVRGMVAKPVPIAAVAAALGWSAGGQTAGPAAHLTGAIDAELSEHGWDGAFSATLTEVDLAAVTATLPWYARGRARVIVDECRMTAGRLTSIRVGVEVGTGGLEQAGLEALVTTLGCRPGPGWRPATRRGEVGFVGGAASLEIDRRGLRIENTDPPGILFGDGGVLLEPPVAGVSLDRVARALSPATTLAVPATPMSGWLLSVFPFPQADAVGTEGERPVEPGRSTSRDLPRNTPPGPVGAGGPASRR
jgi:hypothetical protein